MSTVAAAIKYYETGISAANMLLILIKKTNKNSAESITIALPWNDFRISVFYINCQPSLINRVLQNNKVSFNKGKENTTEITKEKKCNNNNIGVRLWLMEEADRVRRHEDLSFYTNSLIFVFCVLKSCFQPVWYACEWADTNDKDVVPPNRGRRLCAHADRRRTLTFAGRPPASPISA